MQIIVGLGNPGKKFNQTRHNVGFMALDMLAKRNNLEWETSNKFDSEIAKGNGLILIKPQTFMNNSGQAVRAILNYYKLIPKNKNACPFPSAARLEGQNLSDILTVIHDDLDISFGKSRISVDSRSAGHKGVESIIEHLKTKNFKRIRIGIKPTPPSTPEDEQIKISGKNFVLQKFSPEELNVINKIITQIEI